MSISAIQLLQAFNLSQIAEKAYNLEQENKRKKKQQQERLTVASVMSIKGFVLVELFGYHFAGQLKESMYEIAKENKIIRANYQDYYNLMTQQWINMGQYNLFLPLLFRILKNSSNTISFRDVDKYLEVCKTSLNPLIVKLKQKLPPQKIKEMIESLEIVCEKEDLRGTGYVQKIVVLDLIKKYMGEKETLQIDQRFTKNDEINYIKLLSEHYLRAGSKIREIVTQFFLKKVIKVIKKVGKIKKSKKKRQTIKTTSKVTKKKQTKNEKILREYIQQNKKEVKQDRRKIQNIMRSIVYECIFAVMEQDVDKQVKPEQPVFKSVYTAQPTIIEHQLTSLDSSSIKIYGGPNGTAIFVSEGVGKFINLLNGSISYTFKLKPSAIFKNSPLVDYIYFNDMFIGIREDGLLFSWGTQSSSYKNVVQTEYRYIAKKLQHLNTKKILFISQGILIVNESEMNNNLTFFSLDLQFLGRLTLKKQQFGISPCILSEVEQLIKLCQVMPRDSFIKSQDFLESSIRTSYHEKDFILSHYLFKKYKELSVLKLQDYLNWILSYRVHNTLYLDKHMLLRLKRKQPKQEDYLYLIKYQYIKQPNLQAIADFLKNNSVREVNKQQRQWHLNTLFEDNAMKEIEIPYVSREEFFQWIERCSLKPQQLGKLLSNLQFDCEGKVCMYKFINSEQYLKIVSLKNDRFLSKQRYKLNSLPPLLLNQIIPLPALDIFLILPLFPLYNELYVVSVHNTTLNRIDLSQYSEQNASNSPIVHLCNQTGYIFVCYANVITVWNIHQISLKQSQPTKIIKQLEPISRPIMGLSVLYYSNSLATLTKQTVKFWDLDELLFSSQSADIVFQIKPGFKAVEKRSGVCKWELKKKVYIRGKGDSIVAFPTKHSNYLVSVMSRGQKQSEFYLKIFYVSKFKIKIKQQKLYQQIPLKITRLLQQQALKNKYSDSVLTGQKLNISQFELTQLIIQQYKEKLNPSTKSVKSQSCITLINNLQNYYSVYQKYSKILKSKMREMLKDVVDTKYIKYNLIVKQHITQRQSQLEEIFQPQFLNLYKDQNGKVDKQDMLEDLFEWQDRCFLSRLLCLSSLIYKYSRKYQCGYLELVSDPIRQGFINRNSVQSLLEHSHMSKGIMKQTVDMLNEIKIGLPLDILNQIIDKYLSTQYRYPSVRYYKNILSHSPETPSDYFINRFQNYSNHNLKQTLINPKKYSNILVHIEKEGFLEKVVNLTEKYPEIIRDNLQLIDICMSYGIITEEEASYYFLNTPNITLINIIKKTQPKMQKQIHLDQIIQQIAYAIITSKKKLPTPQFTYQWFYDIAKNIVQSDDTIYSMFFDVLNGNLIQHTAYSIQLQFLIDTHKKKVAINYYPLHWKEMVGSRINPLIPHLAFLKQNICSNKIIKSLALQRILQQIVQKNATLLTMRIAFASLNPNSFQKEFNQQKATKQYSSMFINTQHLLKYIEQSKKNREIKIAILQTEKYLKKKEIFFKIAAYNMIEHLSKTPALITFESLTQLLSYNITEYSYGQFTTWIKNLSFRNIKNKDGSYSRVIGVWQLKKILKVDLSMLGWMLLIKHSKISILSKCLVVDGYVDVKQLNQIFMSESIFRLIMQSSKQLQVSQSGVKMDQLQLLLQKQIIGPALKRISQIFKSIFCIELPNIVLLLEQLQRKNEEIELQKLVKYLLPTYDYKEIMPKLALTQIIGKNKRVKIREALTRITAFVNYKNLKEESPLKKWFYRKQKDTSSLLEVVMDIVSSHAIIPNNETKVQNIKICYEHLVSLLGEQFSWNFGFYPSLTLQQFFDHVIQLKNQNGRLPYIINNCVLKLGLHSFLSSFNTQSFPEFYNKCKSTSKTMNKVTPFEFSFSFRRLAQSQKGISVRKLFRLTQYQISAEQRISYIIEYKQKEGYSDIDLSDLRVSNLLQMISQNNSQLESVVNVLKYEEYLIKRYLKSANKLAFILKSIDNSQNMYNLLKQAQLSHNQSNNLIKYLKINGQSVLQSLRLAESKVSGDMDRKEEEIIIANIIFYFKFFKGRMDLQNKQVFNCNYRVKQNTIRQTLLFKKMERQLSPEWSCLQSYINLYQYAQNLLVNVIFKKPYYQRLIKDQVSQTLLKSSLTMRNIYDLLGFAYEQSLHKFLPFLVPCTPNHHSLSLEQFATLSGYLFQSFVKYSQNLQNKYPLSFNAFRQLFIENQAKQQEEKVNHSQIFKKLNIWGCGYVNVNDLPQFRQKNTVNPYIDINTYINLNYPIVQQWRKINPSDQVKRNSEKFATELLQLQQSGLFKQKIIKGDNLWRVLGSYISEQHRLYIQHEFKSYKQKDCYDIVELINWFSVESDEKEKGLIILKKTVQAIEQKGGVYNLIREYKRQNLLNQRVDSYNQQASFLTSLLKNTNHLEYQDLKQIISRLITQNRIQSHLKNLSGQAQIAQNKSWLLQVLILIVDTCNREVREWMNYNNQLVKFLNQLKEKQYNLLKKLYHNNWNYNYHQLFDLMANGSSYFTFNTFWAYSTNNDEAYPYSREEVRQVYQIIDINSDGNISYQQFSRFWCAVDQVIDNPVKPPITSITKTKNQIVESFLILIQPLIDKGIEFENDQVNLSAFQSLTNIKNRQKIQRLVKIISPEDQIALKVDLHKLKVMLRQYKAKRLKQKYQQVKHQNYFAQCFGHQILNFIQPKETLQFSLSKWLYFSYPHYGAMLTQFFFEEFNWSKVGIIDWINQNVKTQKKEVSKVGPKLINPSIQPNNLGFYNQIKIIPDLFYKFYKKNSRKSFQVKKYGESIALHLYLSKSLEDYALILEQVNQIHYFLETVIQNEHLNLIYSIEQDRSWKYNRQLDKNDSKLQQKVKQMRFQKLEQTVDICDNICCTVRSQQSYIKRQYTLKNLELRGKSNNRFSFLTYKALYDNKIISNSILDLEKSNGNQIVVYSDFQNYKPLMSLHLAEDCRFASIVTMIRLVQLALYIQQSYQLCCLFVDPSHLCLQTAGERDFKFTNFYSAIKLDDQGNYLQGVSPLSLIGQSQYIIVPPQTYQQTFTQSYDSYCIAHLLYYLFTGQFITNKDQTASLQQSLWCKYSILHHKCAQHIELLTQEERKIDTQAQIVFFTLIYQCTHFQWHLRPKIFQILQTLLTISQMTTNNLENIGKQLLIKPSVPQLLLKALESKNYDQILQIYTNNEYAWSVHQLQQIRVNIPNQSKYYILFGRMLMNKLKDLAVNYTLQEINWFMKMAVQYVCTSDKKSTAYLALQTYKDIISSEIVKRYFDYCDEMWKINEFNIQEKLKQLNMEDRIEKLPKSSQYYFDISTLIDSKITLYLGETQLKAKKHDSTKKIALTFIQSSLTSNNVNKISAVYKSQVIKNLYQYIQDKQFGDIVLKIYNLITICINTDATLDVHRTVEEGYKVMMVMHNIINLDKGAKKGETVVQMLSFMNNYYNFYGEQCKAVVLKKICDEHVCNLPTLTVMFNTKEINQQLLFQILLNLSFEQKYYKFLKFVTISAYDKNLREIKKQVKFAQINSKIQKWIKFHEFKSSLLQLSVQFRILQSRIQCATKKELALLYSQLQNLIDKHITFYNKKNQQKQQKEVQYRYQNNYNAHFSKFLNFTRRLSLRQIQQNQEINPQISKVIKKIFEFHDQLFEFWQSQQQVIRFFLDMTQKLYQKQYLYKENILLISLQKIIFSIILKLVTYQRQKMIRFGFIHMFFRVMKRQHQLTELYINKKVQNLQLKTSYVQEAEFRLNILHKLLETKQLQIHRMFIIVGFGQYLIQHMFNSNVILDLRFYKSTFNLVPFRFCSPLRSEAITILSTILPINESPLKSEVVSRLIPFVINQKSKLEKFSDSPELKMRFVESLWFFGNLIECEDERLRYEMVNNESYDLINRLIENYSLLSKFFPKMSQTIKQGSILKSSIVFSKLWQK